MPALASEFPVSLRSWPLRDGDPSKSLPSLIQRINSERGGFLGLNEDVLRQEIAKAEADAGGDDDDGAILEEKDEKPDRIKDIVTARDEMLVQIEQAHQQALFALDFVALLISKDQPNQASLSISPFLRENVGMGTLGADKIHASKITDAQKEDNRRIAKGWKIQNLNKSADSILASATRLEKEIEVETEYWKHVLAVRENGWSICRLPNEKHTLGVRFGFSEAGPTFKNRSLAALRREVDGSISLDQGIAASEPQYIRVRIQTNGSETGCSIIPSDITDDAPIEARIQQARDLIFEAELWHEINRESRTLQSLGVRCKGDTILCPLSPSKTAILDLVSLADYSAAPPRSDDNIAEGVSIALHLLQSYAHRMKFHQRNKPLGPFSAFKRANTVYTLLRFLINRANHQSALSSIHALLVPVCSILASTTPSPGPAYTITEPPLEERSMSPTEGTVIALFEQIHAHVTLNISASCTLIMKVRTALFPVANTNFNLSLGPEDCVLQQTCRAPGVLDSWRKAYDYILFATSCALASSLTSPVSNGDKASTKGTPTQAPRWESTTRPHIIRLVPTHQDMRKQRKSKQLSFYFSSFSTGSKNSAAGLKLRVAWEWIGDALEHPSSGMETLDSEAAQDWIGIKGEGFYEWFVLKGESAVIGRGATGEDDSWGQGAIKSLEEVIETARSL